MNTQQTSSRVFRGIDLETIQDKHQEEMIDYVRAKRAGKAKRAELRQRREQARESFTL
jgi:hypothetical protein